MCSVPWGISWVPWRDILFTVGDVQYRGGNLLLFEYPHGTEHSPTVLMKSPMVLMISPTCIMVSSYSTQITKDDNPTVLNTHYRVGIYGFLYKSCWKKVSLGVPKIVEWVWVVFIGIQKYNIGEKRPQNKIYSFQNSEGFWNKGCLFWIFHFAFFSCNLISSQNYKISVK